MLTFTMKEEKLICTKFVQTNDEAFEMDDLINNLKYSEDQRLDQKIEELKNIIKKGEQQQEICLKFVVGLPLVAIVFLSVLAALVYEDNWLSPKIPIGSG